MLLKMYLVEFKRGGVGGLNFKGFLQFKHLKTIFTTRKHLMNLNE